MSNFLVAKNIAITSGRQFISVSISCPRCNEPDIYTKSEINGEPWEIQCDHCNIRIHVPPTKVVANTIQLTAAPLTVFERRCHMCEGKMWYFDNGELGCTNMACMNTVKYPIECPECHKSMHKEVIGNTTQFGCLNSKCDNIQTYTKP